MVAFPSSRLNQKKPFPKLVFVGGIYSISMSVRLRAVGLYALIRSIAVIYVNCTFTRAGKMERYCQLGIARFVPAIKFRRKPFGCRKDFFRRIFSVKI